MPICKIYTKNLPKISSDELNHIERIILEDLEALNERAQVCIIRDVLFNVGEVYIELLCRNKPNRTQERLGKLAQGLQTYVETLLDSKIPIKVRIIKIDESLLFGME